jgi:hypothetical protein
MAFMATGSLTTPRSASAARLIGDSRAPCRLDPSPIDWSCPAGTEGTGSDGLALWPSSDDVARRTPPTNSRGQS